MLSYTLLYRVKFKIAYSQRLSSWLIVPKINRCLKSTLKHYGITLTALKSGFWEGDTLFPLYVVEYRDLPDELPYSSLKLFIKSGKPVQEIFHSMLKSEQTEEVKKAAITVMKLIHPFDAKEVLEQMSLVQERKELEEWALGITKEVREKEKLESELKGKRETAKQMKVHGIPINTISECTGLSVEEIGKL